MALICTLICTAKRKTVPRRLSHVRCARPYDRHSQLAFEPLESRWLFSAIGAADVLLSLAQPTGHAVFQRDGSNRADMTVAGQIASEAVTRIEARAVSMPGFSGSTTDWQVIDTTLPGGDFAGSLTVTAGWYAIEVRAYDGGAMVAAASVDEVGVGEVFVTAGQSNAANYSPYRLTPSDPRVSAYGPDGWQFAADPQPIAGGTGGSPWPALGDAIAQRLDVPVGFISVAVGGTRVDQWQPGGSLYPRLEDALSFLGPQGCRAVLWHQGEYDNLAGTSTADYAARLESVIAQSRVDAGWNVPWGVALDGYLPYGTAEAQAAVVAGQRQVILADPRVFQGAATDDLIAPAVRRTDGHFTEAGLREHASRWADAIAGFLADAAVDPATIDPRLAELIRVSMDGSEVTVAGTGGNDTFALAAGGARVLWVNGLRYESDRMTAIHIHGGDGADSFTLTGTAGNEVAVLSPTSGTIAGPGYAVTFSEVESTTLDGGGGNDQAFFHDSPGNDEFVAAPGFGSLVGPGFSQQVLRFNSVRADASAGGVDVAKLFDSPGNDELVTTPVYARLAGNGFALQAERFDGVHAYAVAGGVDVAKMFDSAGADTFHAEPTSGRLVRRGILQSGQVLRGGPRLRDGRRHRRRTPVRLRRPTTRSSPCPIRPRCTAPDSSIGPSSSSNSMSTAARAPTIAPSLNDSAGDDLLSATGNQARLLNAVSDAWLQRFEQVQAVATAGGRTPPSARRSTTCCNSTAIGVEIYGKLKAESGKLGKAEMLKAESGKLKSEI